MVKKGCFHGEKRLFSWWKNAENAVEKRRFCISKTLFSDSDMVFSCFERAKCEKFHADFRFHFLAFRLRKGGNGVLIFANVMRNTLFPMLECGVRGLHCCGLKKERGKSELRFPPLPIANRRNCFCQTAPRMSQMWFMPWRSRYSCIPSRIFLPA